MFKKLELKTLIIILVGLLAFYLVLDYVSENESNFKSQLTTFDKDEVTKIEYIKKGNQKNRTILERKDDGWTTIKNDKKFSADNQMVGRLISQLYKLSVDRVEAKGKDKWENYKVNEASSTRVKMYAEDELLTDIFIGKFSFSQPEGRQKSPRRRRPNRENMTTFVRLAGEEEVYAVNGFLSRLFPEDVNQLRDRTLVDATNGEINKIEFSGKYNYSLNSGTGSWKVDNRPADSATAASYVSILKTIRGNSFADVRQESLSEPIQTAVIERASDTPITIKAYEAPGSKGYDYVMHSSVNKGAWFTSEGKLFDRIFKKPSHFLKN